jgi:tRNA nucleotidyltransferase (CCA-adding enzyme)
MKNGVTINLKTRIIFIFRTTVYFAMPRATRAMCYNYIDCWESAMSILNPQPSYLPSSLLKALTTDQKTLLRRVAGEASHMHLPLYLVGGVVRDIFLGRPATDLDLVVEGDAIGLARKLVNKYGGKLTVHSRFGTAQWFLPASLADPGSRFAILDLTSTRSETYPHPGALPSVRKGNISDDLIRRDFTINTLAIRLDMDRDDKILDELGGLEDLRKGIIRALHTRSFIDDPTRLFRAVRYEQRYGFHIDPQTETLISGALRGIKRLSAERVRHELDLVLEEQLAPAMLTRLADLGILAAVHPSLGWNVLTQDRFRTAAAATQEYDSHLSARMLAWALWLMDVPRRRLAGIDKRLHFEAHTRDVLLAASALYADIDSFSGKAPSRIVAKLDKYPTAAIRAVFLALPPDIPRENLKNYIETWRHVKPKTSGDDLLTLGLPPGPRFQTILQRLRNGWLDGSLETTRDEKALLVKLIKRDRGTSR